MKRRMLVVAFAALYPLWLVISNSAETVREESAASTAANVTEAPNAPNADTTACSPGRNSGCIAMMARTTPSLPFCPLKRGPRAGYQDRRTAGPDHQWSQRDLSGDG